LVNLLQEHIYPTLHCMEGVLVYQTRIGMPI